MGCYCTAGKTIFKETPFEKPLGYGFYFSFHQYNCNWSLLPGEKTVKVLKCINNNVISCCDQEGREMVAMGRGLGYSVRPGDEIEESRAEKLFRMENTEQTRKLTDLFASLPAREVELCSRIVDRAMESLGKLSPSVYLTLTDHVCFAIERHRQGIVFQNSLLAEVKFFYPREYAMGRYALELIASELDIRFTDDEAANIALHLVNAEFENTLSETIRITTSLHDIIAMLSSNCELNLETGSVFYNELTVQLKFLVFRAFDNAIYSRADPAFVKAIKRCFPSEFSCAEKISELIYQRCGVRLPQEELAFLATSIRRTSREQN